eukprot:Seg1865.9 transcript_id=Seg1865.9/GoldUCD/mRNA.D3Y31 product="NAD-dependent protein deacetylase sirtuin-1" protein_id=Seg1865.9/GoldUCD/D3Y31
MADNTKTSETMKEFHFIPKDLEATTSKNEEISDAVKEDDVGMSSERSLISLSAESQENMADEKVRPVLVQNASTGERNLVNKETKGGRIDTSRSILDKSETEKCDHPLNKSVLVDEKGEGVGDAKENDEKAATCLNEATGSESSIVVHTSVDEAEDDDECLDDMRIFEISQDTSGQPKGPLEWIMRQIALDKDPREIISQLMPGVVIPNGMDNIMLWKGVFELITEPKARQKLDHVNTLEDVVKMIETSKKIIVLTGAGVSVSCGIPDFRSRDGIYARLSKDFPDLPDPQSMFDIHYFRRDQRPFFKFAKEIYPGQFKPSLSHNFIAALDKKDKLLRNFTQNIDTLEQVAGINRVVQCHGSFATASCTNCKYQVNSDFIRKDIFDQVIPKCPICPQDESILAVMKPDIIFFGEGLPDEFYKHLDVDKHEADLLIVIGSSLKVRPVALIPDYVKPDVPQVLINREPLHHFNFDVELLGNCDAIISELCRRLGGDWNDVIADYTMPPLNKEAVEKMFEESLSSDVEESDESCAEGSDDTTPLQGRTERGVVNESEELKGGLNIEARTESGGNVIESEDKEELIINKEFEKSDEKGSDNKEFDDSVPIHLDQILCVDTKTINCESKTEEDTVIGCKNCELGDENKEKTIYENGEIIENKTELILLNKSRKLESNMQIGNKRTIEGTSNESCRNCQLVDSETEKGVQKPREEDTREKDTGDHARNEACRCNCDRERKRKKMNPGGNCSTDTKNNYEGKYHTVNPGGVPEKKEEPPSSEGESSKSEDAETGEKEVGGKLRDEVRGSSPLFDKEAIMQKFGDEGGYC